ncbi:hypothetical protein EA58_13290 [Photobacterium galatheae]|uniref:AB hydrolase-1 domain-containing protein n=1 Tax=Photobacterium galatheae TaxID=1654360 RepID=A0A066RL08_9GAMM|nr:hypothetical protein EA58_13290 [Photobacterium galatheae]
MFPANRQRFQGISYLDIGQGPVLVLGHAFLWDSGMWDHQVARLSQHFRCIVPDFWGHGASEPAPAASATLADYAQVMCELLDHLEIETVGLIGHSMGGSWAIEFAVQAPARVRALVLLDSFAGLEPEVVNLKYQAMLREAEDNQSFSPTCIDTFTPLQFGRNAGSSHPELIKVFRSRLAHWQGAQVTAITQAGQMWFGRRDSFEDAEKLALPCLLMVGAEDRIRSVLESHLMLDGITGSQLQVIADAGHLCPLEQPEIVTEGLLAFCQNVME